METLKALDGVKSVEEIEIKLPMEEAKTTDKNIYMVKFEQPLDWKDPSAGTFEQRVQVCYGEQASNEFNIGGYMLSDETLQIGSKADAYASKYPMNLVNVEYRFYGRSKPEGISETDPKYWNYLTSYNAACDFHHIITELKKVLPGKWMMTGASKGGVATMIQSMYYPEDAAVFMPQICPFAEGPQDDRFGKNINETIGDDKYGAEQAAEYRKLVLDYQVELIKNREALQQKLYDFYVAHGAYYSSYATPEIVYDVAVLDVATGIWQYKQQFSLLQGIMDDKEEEDFLNSAFQFLVNPSTDGIRSEEEFESRNKEKNETSGGADIEFFPYYIQCANELGYYKMDFSYLRKALAEDGSGAQLVVTEDMEDMLFYKIHVEPAILDTLKWDNSIRDGILNWSMTTKAKVVMIYGGSDVWYALRIPDVPDRENFRTYVDESGAHSSGFSGLPWNTQKEIKDFIDAALA